MSQKKKQTKGKNNSYQTSPRAKKQLEKKLAKNNSKSIRSGNFDFDPEEFLDKSLLFDLKQTREEQISDAILEEIPDNDKCYIEHREGTNAFRIRKDGDKNEKGTIITIAEDLDEKINKTINKSKFSQLKRTRNKLLKRYKGLGETFIEINDKKTETLDRLLELDRKLQSGEI